MDKYLILKFRNAGLFRKHGRTKDKIYDSRGVRDRKNELEFIEPITIHQVSGMLHALFGERPKSSNRYSSYDKIDYYFEKAGNSYLKINSYLNSKGKFYNETIHLNKPFFNSFNPVSYINWERVKRLLEDNNWELFKNVTKDVFGYDITKTPISNSINLIKNSDDNRIKELFDRLKSEGKTPLYDVFFKDVYVSMNSNARTLVTQTIGLDKFTRLSGDIIVPVSDDDINRLKTTKGCATILDGGMVYIVGVKSGNFLNVDDFEKVSEISLEKK